MTGKSELQIPQTSKTDHADYKAEQAQEIEVLESIYPEELTSTLLKGKWSMHF